MASETVAGSFSGQPVHGLRLARAIQNAKRHHDVVDGDEVHYGTARAHPERRVPADADEGRDHIYITPESVPFNDPVWYWQLVPGGRQEGPFGSVEEAAANANNACPHIQTNHYHVDKI